MSNANNMSSKKTEQVNHIALPGTRRGSGIGYTPIEKPTDVKNTLVKLLTYFTAERRLLISILFTTVLLVTCSVIAPSFQSQAIDKIAEGDFDNLNTVLSVMIILYLCYCLGLLIQNLLSAYLSQGIVRRMREDLFAKIVNLPIKYTDNHPHGDIMSRMTNDVENISNTVAQSISALFSGLLTILGTVTMMMLFCWQLALLSCSTVILTVLATKYLSYVMRKFFTKRQVLLGKLNSRVEENISGYKTVVAYNQQNSEIDNFNDTSDELTKTGILAEIFGSSMGPVMNVINNAGFVIITAFGGYFAIHGLISIGVVSAFIVYAQQFGRPINEVAQIYGQIQTALASAERIFTIMNEPDEDKRGHETMQNIQGVIRFNNVNFSYTPGKQVLYDFNLEVRAGHKVALVGATGSGKTTVINLLMRFYDIDSGSINIDGVDIRNIHVGELRHNIAIVLQDTVLFSDTVRNNLKFSNLAATDAEMEQAAQMSHCDVLIRRLPQGYDTVLARAGHNLSQGQRQLLSIGRAFLAHPKILILDEATSSIDTRTEQNIQQAMTTLMKDRTSLIIAHRLSTIRDADHIVVMDQGRIIEEGNHEVLFALKGRYYELYMTQFEGREI